MLTEYRIPSKRLNGYVVLTKVDILKSFAREAPTVGSSKSAARRRAREPYRNPRACALLYFLPPVIFIVSLGVLAVLPPTRGTSVRDSSAGMEEVDVSSDVSQGRRSLEDMPLDLKPRGDPDAVSDASGEEMDEDVSEDDFPFGDEEVEPVGRRALRRQSRVRGAPQRGGTATRLSFDGVGDMGEAEEDLKVIRRPAPSRKQQQQQAAAAASSKQPIGRSLWSFYGDTPQAAFPKRPRKLAKDNVGMTMEDVGPAKDDIRKRVGRTGRRRGV